MALEVKKRYNKFFDGVLPPLIRLHLPIRNMVVECIRRFGMQSIDIVFEQVRLEKFSQGDNRTGFIASFQYIFEPANFQKYLERAQLRRKKQQTVQEKQPAAMTVATTEPQPTEEDRLKEKRQRFLGMVALVSENPRSACYAPLTAAYESGELQRLGINWKPNNI